MRVAGLKSVFTAEQIAERIREMGGEIDRIYAGKPLVMVCVLKGAFMFFADLARHVTVRPELDFVCVSSYSGRDRPGVLRFTKDIELSLDGKHVLLIEDIVDTGHTMGFLIRQFQARGAESLRIAALVDKRERREVEVTVDFVGFALPRGFIVGYGVDYAEQYRELPGIFEAVLE